VEQTLLGVAHQYGPWAALCVFLIIGCSWLIKWVLTTTNERETRLMGVISQQSDTMKSQSSALNSITEKLQELAVCVASIERRLP
jgi:hypothetical protein